jgi:hypothetical protein
MRYLVIGLFIFLFFQGQNVFSQEQVMLSTYYPSPDAAYRDLDIHQNLTFKDTDGGADDTVINTDGAGNLLIDASTVAGNYHIVFVDGVVATAQNLCYIRSYSGAVPNPRCATGWEPAAFLDGSKDPTPSATDPGYIVCIRAEEF